MIDRCVNLVLGLAAFLGSSTVYANGKHTAGEWGDGFMGHGWSGMMFGPFMMILFIVVVVAIVVLIVRWLSGSHAMGSGTAEKTAIDVLEERYARGEIDKDEFLDRRRVLME